MTVCSGSPPAPSNYEFVKDLGEGANGCVVLAKHRATGELVAIKKLRRTLLLPPYVESEILNHSTLHHHHVVGFKDVFLTPQHINIVMDFASGGSLFAYVQQRGRLKEALARWFFQQLVLAVDYCHKKGVSNRDIKLENTLLHVAEGLPLPLVKICDFGYSKHDARSGACSRVGTFAYMAPEVMTARGPYDAKRADVWSCGVVLYTMLVGSYPFAKPDPNNPDTVHGMLRAMAERRFPLPAELGLSQGCAALLKRLLEPEPAARVTLDEVMQDPWFQSHLPPGALDMNPRALAADAAPEARAARGGGGGKHPSRHRRGQRGRRRGGRRGRRRRRRWRGQRRRRAGAGGGGAVGVDVRRRVTAAALALPKLVA